MARTPNRTGLGDNYKEGGKRRRATNPRVKRTKKMQHGGSLGEAAGEAAHETINPTKKKSLIPDTTPVIINL